MMVLSKRITGGLGLILFHFIEVATMASAKGNNVLQQLDGASERIFNTMLQRMAALESKVTELETREKAMEDRFRSEIEKIRLESQRETSRIRDDYDAQIALLVKQCKDGLGKENDANDESSLSGQEQPDTTHDHVVVRRKAGIRAVDDETYAVGFFATLESQLPHLGNKQPIIYERVLTNVGNAYDVHTGQFRAPVDGIYMFSTTVKPAGIVSGGNVYGFFRNSTWLSTMQVTHDNDVSQTIVVFLFKGDDVSVRHVGNDHQLYGANYNIFAGALISRDVPVTTGTIIG